MPKMISNPEVLDSDIPVKKNCEERTRKDFEIWVNKPHLLNRRSVNGLPGDYINPTIQGAWIAWKYLTQKGF